MPELPEVEILARHLAPLLEGRRIVDLQVCHPQLTRGDTPGALRRAIRGATLVRIGRRAKYLVFGFRGPRPGKEGVFLGHLGMTGRMLVLPKERPLPQHTAAYFDLGEAFWVFQDVRRFGRLTLHLDAIDGLGPEPLSPAFTVEGFQEALAESRQPIKVRLLDQRIVAGMGNIYASEALHEARLSPRRAAAGLLPGEVLRLHAAIQAVLALAVRRGSSLPLDFTRPAGSGGVFYHGLPPDTVETDAERFKVYDRAARPCPACSTKVKRIVQGGRSTYFCPTCQK